MAEPERNVAGERLGERFAASYVASTVAIVAMMPLQFQGGHFHYYNVLGLALLPAFAAWLFVRKRPQGQQATGMLAVALALAFVGGGGLGLLAVADHMSGLIRETIELGRFPTQAEAYLAIGLFGVLASLVFGRTD
jgi:hypothetical protein